MRQPNIANILKMANHKAEQSDIWKSGVLAFEFILCNCIKSGM